MSAASDYMTTALTSLDTQLTELQTRLAADAQELQDAIAALDLAGQDTTALTAAADRVSATATLVSGLAQPTAVTDETQPDAVVEPIPVTSDPATDVPPAEQTPEFPAPGA